MSLDQECATKAAYVVRDYSHVQPGEPSEPMLMVVPANGILEVLDEAKKSNKKIAVYEIGRRVLDWS